MKTCTICGRELTGRQLVTCSKQCRNRRLIASDAFKAARARYRQTDKYVTTERARRSTPEFKEARAAYARQPAALERERERNRRRQSERTRQQSKGRRRRAAQRRLAKAAVGTRGRMPIAGGWCVLCGAAFLARLTNDLPRYCGQRCKIRHSNDRRRALKRGAYVAPVFRAEIYARDDWTCQLCCEPVDREATAPEALAPTLDHIIPLARGGTHEPSNVQCAHFICNSVKGDRYVA